MSSLPVAWTAEGGSDTTVISAGNSGGGSGTAFDSVTNPSSIMKFSATQEHAGALAMGVTQPGVAVTTYGVWNGWGALTSNVYIRTYFYVTATTATNLMLAWRSDADAAVSYMGLNSSGKLIFQRGSTTVAALTSTATISANTWYRLEARILPSLTVGEIEWQMFTGANLEGATPDETKSATALVMGGANIDGIRFGHGVTSGGPATSITGYHDDVGISTAGFLGPATAAASSPRMFGLLGVGT